MNTTPYAATVTMLNEFLGYKPFSDSDVLYHYTDAAGLKGILETQTLWLSDSYHLNDHREQLEARDATLETMKAILRRTPEKAHVLLRHADSLMGNINLHGPRTALNFIGCFSTQRDSLTQWRSYGRGEGGFAIGFKAKALLEIASAERLGQGVGLLPCNYDLEAYKLAIERAFELAEQDFIDLSQTHGEASAFREFVFRIGWYSNAVKSRAFESEHEWRLIYQPLGNMENPRELHHFGNSTFRPYVKFSWAATKPALAMLSEIVVGPQRHMDLAKQGLESFVRTTLGGLIPIRQSGVPYRTM